MGRESKETVTKHIVAPKDVYSRIKMVKKMQKLGDPKFKEYHQRIYYDGIWTVDIEVHQYGTIRWWVSREDAAGNYNNSLFTVYRADNGELRYSADYKIKKSIVERLLKIYEYLEKDGLVA